MIDRVLVILMLIFCIFQTSLTIKQGMEIDQLQQQIAECKAKDYTLQNEIRRNGRLIDQNLELITKGGWDDRM